MKLVIGGAFQGKTEYARKHYRISDAWVDGSVCTLEELESCCGVYRFHEFVHRMVLQRNAKECGTEPVGFRNGLSGKTGWELTAEADAASFTVNLLAKNPEIVIVTNELGYGIVPMDPIDREYRETTGRICTALAARAEEVVRVVCGIGMQLKKGEEKND